jgi:hypothetical protein
VELTHVAIARSKQHHDRFALQPPGHKHQRIRRGRIQPAGLGHKAQHRLLPCHLGQQAEHTQLDQEPVGLGLGLGLD